MSLAEDITRSAATLRQRLGGDVPPIAIVLGSGWGALAGLVEGAVEIPYADLPAFPVLGVGGHVGLIRAGVLGQRRVLVLAGRKHAYETGEADGTCPFLDELSRPLDGLDGACGRETACA